jgi:hypothetical protein
MHKTKYNVASRHEIQKNPFVFVIVAQAMLGLFHPLEEYVGPYGHLPSIYSDGNLAVPYTDNIYSTCTRRKKHKDSLPLQASKPVHRHQQIPMLIF